MIKLNYIHSKIYHCGKFTPHAIETSWNSRTRSFLGKKTPSQKGIVRRKYNDMSERRTASRFLIEFVEQRISPTEIFKRNR